MEFHNILRSSAGRRGRRPLRISVYKMQIEIFRCVRTTEPPSEREGDHEVVEGACESETLMMGFALFI